MLFRVRNLIDNEMHLYSDKDCAEITKPVDDLSLTAYIQEMIRTSHQSLRTEGIEIDRYNERAKEDTYFKLYRLYLKKNHLSFTYFRSYLSSILRSHGLTITYDKDDKDVKDDNINSNKNVKDDMNDIALQIKKEDAENIIHSTPINSDEYSRLAESRKEKTRDENLSMKRYVLTNTFDRKYDDPLTLEWVQTNIHHVIGYRNFRLYEKMTKEKALSECIDKINRLSKQKMVENTKKIRMLRPNKGEGENSSSESEGSDVESPYRRKQIKKNIHTHIHYDKAPHRLYHCLQFIFMAGFSSLGDNRKIKIDYNALHAYCKENESTMRAVFGSKVMHWKGMLDGSEKKALSKFVNQKLEACLGVRLTPTSKGSDMKYKLNHLFVL